MPAYASHLTFIASTAAQFPQRPCFRIPQFEAGSDDNASHRRIIGWKDITYGEFLQDINLCAAYWTRTFRCPPDSIIGLWMLGTTYRDFVHLFGLLAARFVPQLLNLKIQSLDAAISHFKQTNITHVIYAPGAPPIAPLINHFHVHEMVNIEHLSSLVQLGKPDPTRNSMEEHGDDVLMIYHTSGSTSGRPKLVRYTRKWIDGHARKPIPGIPDGKEVGIAINGISHGSQLVVSLQQFANAACGVIIPWNDFTGAELVQIIKECKVNALYQLTPILCQILREAMTNSELEALLKSLEFIVLGGAALTENERLYAIKKGIKLKNIYGSTEMGITMMCDEDAQVFYPVKLPGFMYNFRNANHGAEHTHANRDSAPTSSTRLAEFVILPGSLDCPHSTLCDPVDGSYRSKDLFEQVAPDAYKYRGRSDDMIIMSKGQLTDTLHIEGQVLLTCADLISACVVVGSGKPSPVLLAEPVNNHPYGRYLKEEIGKRVMEIHKYGFPHERIHPSHVIMVSPGVLPRTPKGNVIRSAAERVFKQDIDALFT